MVSKYIILSGIILFFMPFIATAVSEPDEMAHWSEYNAILKDDVVVKYSAGWITPQKLYDNQSVYAPPSYDATYGYIGTSGSYIEYNFSTVRTIESVGMAMYTGFWCYSDGIYNINCSDSDDNEFDQVLLDVDYYNINPHPYNISQTGLSVSCKTIRFTVVKRCGEISGDCSANCLFYETMAMFEGAPTDTVAPYYTNFINNASNVTHQFDDVNFSITTFDETGVQEIRFRTNITGEWLNYSDSFSATEVSYNAINNTLVPQNSFVCANFSISDGTNWNHTNMTCFTVAENVNFHFKLNYTVSDFDNLNPRSLCFVLQEDDFCINQSFMEMVRDYSPPIITYENNKVSIAGNLSINSLSATRIWVNSTELDYPLVVLGSTNGITGYFEANVSASGYTTRTTNWDKSKDIWTYIKDSDYYNYPNGTINHEKFYGYTSVNGKGAVSLNMEVDMLRQGQYELKKLIDALTIEIEELNKRLPK